MPGVKNKLIINGNGLRAFGQIIKGWFRGIGTVIEGSEFLAEEIEDNNWLWEPEALEFKKEQETDCAEIDAACQTFIEALSKFHANQMDRNNRMRQWVDKKLSQKTP